MKTRGLLLSLTLGLGLTLVVLGGLGGNLPRVRADTYTVTNTTPAALAPCARRSSTPTATLATTPLISASAAPSC